MTDIKQQFTTPDGGLFDTKAEAQAHLRKPVIKDALSRIPGVAGNNDLAEWLLENQEVVEVAFETGTIRRVTKVDRNKLDKAVKAMMEIDNPKIAFLKDNSDALLDSFRWPAVKRMTDEEKATAARNTLVAASDNEDLAAWVLGNREAVLLAYGAGIEKRVVNPKASEGLALYRAKKLAEKQERDAAEAEGPEALAAYTQKRATQDAADKAAKEAAKAE